MVREALGVLGPRCGCGSPGSQRGHAPDSRRVRVVLALSPSSRRGSLVIYVIVFDFYLWIEIE
jgi:hypothetical protein